MGTTGHNGIPSYSMKGLSMAKRKNDRQLRERTSLTINPALMLELKDIHTEYGDRFKRLRTNIIDTGMRITMLLINKYGANWFYDNMERLPNAIFERFEEMKKRR